MENDKAIDVLNTLITINNDRIEGYETASNETDDYELKALFSEFSKTSQKCKNELAGKVVQLGGTPAEGTMASGKFYRAWMDFKAAITGKDRKSILNSCEYGEDIAVKTYRDALEEDAPELSADLQSLIEDQHAAINSDHNRVRALRDAWVEID